MAKSRKPQFEELYSPKEGQKAVKELAKFCGISKKQLLDEMRNPTKGLAIFDSSGKSIPNKTPGYASPIEKLCLLMLGCATREKASEIRMKLYRNNFKVSYLVRENEYDMIPPPNQMYDDMISALKGYAKDKGTEYPGFDFQSGDKIYKIDVITTTSRSRKEGLVLRINK